MGLSFMHLIVIVIILLLIFGPSKLPQLGKSVGEAIRGFKQGIDGAGDIDVTPTVKRDQIQNQDQPEANKQTQTANDTTKNKPS